VKHTINLAPAFYDHKITTFVSCLWNQNYY